MFQRLFQRWLAERLRAWVDAGLVSSQQASAIAELERTTTERQKTGRGADAAGPGLSPLAEAASYLGILLVVVSGAFVVQRFWDDLHGWGRLSVGLVVTGAGFGAAAATARLGDAGSQRLSSFLQLCGTGGVALTAGVIAVALGSHDPGVTAVVVGPSVLAVSFALWRNGDRPLPFLAATAGLVVTLAGLHDVLHLGLTPTEVAAVIWVTCIAVAVISALRLLHPALPALLVSEMGAIGASLAIANAHHALGIFLGLATGVGGVAAGLSLRHTSMVVVGVLGSLIFLIRMLALYIRGMGSALTVLAIGVVIVVLAIRKGPHHGSASGSGGAAGPNAT